MADTPSRFPKRRSLLSVSTRAAALLVVLVVMFVHLFVVALPSRHSLAQARLAPSSSPTPTVVPTLPPTNLLSWHSVAFPPGFSGPDVLTSLAVAPSDADTAYACSLASQPHAIWVTHDRGLRWQIVGHLPTGQAGSCDLVVDSTQPDTLVATSTANPTNGASPIAVVATDFASSDGGVPWQALRSGEEYGEWATYQGTTYALRADLVDQSKRVPRDQ